MEHNHLSEVTFASLDLPEPLRRGIEDAGFVHCTPIQAEALPLALAGTDVAGQAQTGTGKSAAFLLAAFNHMLKHPAPEGRKKTQPRCVILAPTRELAVQIHKDSVVLGAHTGFKQVLVFGGTGYEQQRNDLEAGVDVLIGTPGRLIDYFKQHVFDLRQVQVAILDEADRMFDLGFIDDIRYVLRKMPAPEQRLNMLFSATLSQKVLELAYEDMDEPVSISIEPEKVTADRIRQVVYFTANEEKLPLLVHLLRSGELDRTMVFVNMKREAERVQAWLETNGIHAEQISGDVPQRKRLALMKAFSGGNLPVLVATDVASRGLHIPDVSHIVNYDMPQDAEDYVHRIGRTARAGASGDAISFGCETYAFHLPEIEEYVGFQIPVGQFDHDTLPKLERPPYRPRSGRDGGRGGRDGGRGGRGGRDGGRGGSRGGQASHDGARGGSRSGSRGGRPDNHGDGRRDEQRDRRPAAERAPQAAAADPKPKRPDTEQAPPQDGAVRKKRRRRRGGRGRKRGGGEQAAAAPQQEQPKKKGFFARLLGR
jgi:ATP-dependent RNA helicase RhlB